MNYFGGSIAEAVAQSKQRHAIIVVFVEGPNESSKQLAALIDAESIRSELESAKYVAIRIHSETEAYRQFAEVYKLVPLPSIFFIGDNGAPLVIVTEATKTVPELEAVIQSIQQPIDAAAAVPSASTTASIPSAAPQVPTASAAGPSPSATDASPPSAIPVDVRIARARDMVEKKRQEQEAEKQRLEKERELERRRAGQDLRSFKERQQELDMKQLKEERQRDKLAEQAQRKRILEQIAQDRAMSAARFANNAATEAAAAPAPAAPAPAARVYTGTEARIQFRKPDGSVAAHEFQAADNLQVVREYVAVELLSGNRNFSLASSFPRRQLAEADDARTLAELELAPTAVILVTSSDRALRGEEVAAGHVGSGASSAVRGAAAAVSRLNVWQLAQSAFWIVVAPVLAAWGYLRGLVSGGGGRGDATTGAQKRENEERVSDNDAAKRRNLRFFQPDSLPTSSAAAAAAGPSQQPGTSIGAYKRVGGAASNIHRLHETQDSDDDTNTWNGNSTQQQ